MIDAMEALEIAKAQLVGLLGPTEISHVPMDEITLEEIELTDNSKSWEVTLGYPIPEPAGVSTPSPEVSALFRRVPLKKFKVIKISSENGQFISMKNCTP